MIEVRDRGNAASVSGDGDSKILNQEEIDTLFGYSADKEGEDDGYTMKTGVQAILNSSMVSYERLPMLDIVFDRLIRMMATSLRNFTQDNVEVSLDNIESMRFGEYIDSLTLPTLLGVFKAEEWDNYGLMSFDSSLVYSIVDVLLGGRRGTAAMRIEGRPYTPIELNLVKDMIDLSHVQLRPAGNQSPLCHHLPLVQRGHCCPPADRHGRPRRQNRSDDSLCHAGTHPRPAAPNVYG